jgi:hypothetical protein
VREAVERLLSGTGLTYSFLAENAVAVKMAETDPPSATKQAAQQSKPQDLQTTVLEEMTVTGQPTYETSYTVPNATTATKTDTPIMETPVNIQSSRSRF